jgi:hypothetical protein
VLGALHGYDEQDAASVARPLHWPARRSVQSLRVGYFENDKPLDERPEIRVLKDLGVTLVPIKLPSGFPYGAPTTILNVETAAAFDDITLGGVREGLGKWAMPFRTGRFIPAVEYLRANRIRTLLMKEMDELMQQVDAYVEGDDLVLTNLTGHPTIVIPFGDRQESAAGNNRFHRPAVWRERAFGPDARVPAGNRRPFAPPAAGETAGGGHK